MPSVKKSGSLNRPEPFGPHRPVIGIALPFNFGTMPRLYDSPFTAEKLRIFAQVLHLPEDGSVSWMSIKTMYCSVRWKLICVCEKKNRYIVAFISTCT